MMMTKKTRKMPSGKLDSTETSLSWPGKMRQRSQQKRSFSALMEDKKA